MTSDVTSGADYPGGLSPEDLEAEAVTPLPDKEVVSILDLNADLDLGLDLAAPIDLAVGANANVAAPIDAAVGANVLSAGSTAQALSDQGVMITHSIVGDAHATASQASSIDHSGAIGAPEPAAPAETSTGVGDAAGTAAGSADGAAGAVGDTAGTVGGAVGDTTGSVGDTAGSVGDAVGSVGDTVSGIDTGDALSGDVLNVNVNLAADAHLTAPIAGAVAANANVAAPIEASAAANIGSVGSDAVAVSHQDAIIDQSIDGNATAVSDQDSQLSQ